jgi:hypothetical protein
MRKLVVLMAMAVATAAHADDVLHPGTPELDPPTLTALGIGVPITGDDNFTGTVAVRYREAGTTTWHDAAPLMHVHAEAVAGITVAPQFAGSIFDLRPDTVYDIELHATDADGNVDSTMTLSARTRAMPSDPASPRVVAVSSASTLSAALAAAQPGDVITLAPGTYSGSFSSTKSGTATAPIVIRGESPDTVILDGGNCTSCNILEVYGSFVHVESLTIQNGIRAIRFQSDAAEANVVRRVHIRDVTLGIGSHPSQRDFYIADNILEGRLTWPCTYISDDPACNAGGTHGLHANDDGIRVEGTGHVIAHNRISGFGDAMKVEQDGARSVDFVGNDVLWTYDNGVELDGSSRNTRALRNRFTNTYATLSFQPIFGGPAYAIRNVLVNVKDEQFKLHSRGGTPTVGAVILHNTVVRGTRALQCSAAEAPLHFIVANNLFIGPATVADDHPVRWDVPGVTTGSIDYNGYYPDGQFELGYGASGITYPTFNALAAGGRWEMHGVLVGASTLMNNLVGPADDSVTLAPTTPTLADGSTAIDRGMPLPGIADDFLGTAPDLGALEAGCDAPIYGPRPSGVDESNEKVGCTGDDGSNGDDAGTGDDGGVTMPSTGGCCDAHSTGGSTSLLVLVVGLLLARRRKSSCRESLTNAE